MVQPRRPGDRSIAGIIARDLGDRIIAGDLLPGARLLQDQIAQAFETSHVPVREAFRRLEARGLVESEPRRGVRVSILDPATVTEVTAMRAALETLAMRQAMGNLGPEALATADDAIREAEQSDDIRVWEAANRRFHRALADPCRMPRLLRAIEDLHDAGARFLFVTWRDLDWQPRSEAEHRAILAAVRDGDVEAAVRLLNAHVLDAGAALSAAIR